MSMRTLVASAQTRRKIFKKKFLIIFFKIIFPARADTWVHPCGCLSCTRGRGKLFFIFYFLFLCPREHTFVLMFFLGGWKCEWGVDVDCGQKRFFDQISNPHIWGYNASIWAFFFFIDRHMILDNTSKGELEEPYSKFFLQLKMGSGP
jgi:hypothetical protein